MSTMRKNISISSNTYETINTYAKKCGKTFSEFIRDAALKEIINNEKRSLLEYMNENCSYVSKKEQKEIENLNIDFDKLDGKELSLDELL